MKLLSIEDYQLKVADELLLVKPFRKLWHQDRSQRKEVFYQQLSYVFHMVDPRSSYSYIQKEEDKIKAIIEQEGLPEDFKPTPLLKEAMEIYKKLIITPSQKLLEASLTAADTVSKFLKTVDLTEEDDKGRPKYQVSTITTALKNVEGIVTSLQNLQNRIDQEIKDKTNARGSQELTVGDVLADQGL